jgi:hypothetical protein
MTTPSVVDFAVEVLQMNRRIMELEAEVERLSFFKEEYFKLMEHSNNHTNRLFGIALLGAIGDIEGAQALADS